MSDAISQRLKGQVLAAIDADGPIPFERYMEQVLYAPEIGYYTGPRTKIGKQGDFFTSLDVHPVFGRLIAAQIIEMSAALPEGCYTVVEMGAGKGLLAYDVLRTIEAAAPALFARLRYVIVDVSSDLIARQKKLLKGYAKQTEWAADLSALAGVCGVYISNELVDSLPHHQVVMTEDGLKELYVARKGERLVEHLGPLSRPELAHYFADLGIDLATGYRTEVNLRALSWMRQVAKGLSRGHVLTIDYGYPADVYYQSDRKRGTFLCFHQHKVSEDPYARVGLQDLTAHVDFTSLARAGRDAGLQLEGMTDQAHFLVGMGITTLMEQVLQRDGGDPQKSDEFCAMRKLMDPGGMGKTFKVLVQSKGLSEMSLSGVRFPAFSHSDALGVRVVP